MQTSFLEAYDPSWLLEQSFSIGIPTKNIKTTKEICERLLKIQTIQRFAGVDPTHVLIRMMTPSEIEENFSEKSISGSSPDFFHFSRTDEGADSDATVYFAKDMCCITYFSLSQDFKSIFNYEWYKKNEDGNWIEFYFYENRPLHLIYRFINGDIPAIDLVTDFESEGKDDADTLEELNEEEAEVLIKPIEEISELMESLGELVYFDKYLKLLYSREVAPLLNIDPKLMTNFHYSLLPDSIAIEAVEYQNGKLWPLGFFQNLNEPWCNINMVVIENQEGETIIGIIERERRS